MMRILHILHQFLPNHVGGVEHYTRNLALAQQQAGHQVTLFCRESGVGQELIRETWEGLPIYRAIHGAFSPARRFRSTLGDPFLASSLKRVLQETQPELVHIQHLMGLPAHLLAAVHLSAPMVVTLHDYWWVCANAQLVTDYGGALCEGPHLWLNCACCGLARSGAGQAWPLVPCAAGLFAWRASILKRLGTRVDAWIAPTVFVRNWYVSHGLPAERLHVVGHGIEPPPADPTLPGGQALTLPGGQALTLPGGQVLVRPVSHTGDGHSLHLAYIGGLAPQKGVHVLIDAFNALPESCQLAIAGDETSFPDYCADLRRRARHPGIHFYGRLDRTQVWQALAAADALVVPSLWFETASLVIQEAFAAGTPVIASDLGALSERVSHEVDGLLFAPGDAGALRRALQRLLDEPDLLPRLRKGIVPPMNMADHAAQLETIYASLACGGRSQRNAGTLRP